MARSTTRATSAQVPGLSQSACAARIKRAIQKRPPCPDRTVQPQGDGALVARPLAVRSIRCIAPRQRQRHSPTERTKDMAISRHSTLRIKRDNRDRESGDGRVTVDREKGLGKDPYFEKKRLCLSPGPGPTRAPPTICGDKSSDGQAIEDGPARVIACGSTVTLRLHAQGNLQMTLGNLSLIQSQLLCACSVPTIGATPAGDSTLRQSVQSGWNIGIWPSTRLAGKRPARRKVPRMIRVPAASYTLSSPGRNLQASYLFSFAAASASAANAMVRGWSLWRPPRPLGAPHKAEQMSCEPESSS